MEAEFRFWPAMARSGHTALALLFAAVLFLNGAPSHPSDPTLRADQRKRIEALCASSTDKKSPGFALGIIKDGALIFKGGFGLANLDYEIPITTSTAFQIASLSKQFTAASFLMLSRRHLISLDDDIRKYIPEMPTYCGPVRIQNLIHHTSGIRDYEDLQLLKGELSDQGYHNNKDLLELIAAQKGLDFLPGEKCQYSNSGYTLLSIILERVTGMTLGRFVKQNIFDPLGMKNTFILDDNTVIIKNRATGYSLKKDGRFRVDETLNESTGDGGVYTTVEDFFFWDQNFVNGTVGGSDFVTDLLRSGRLNDGRPATMAFRDIPIEYAFGIACFPYRGLRTIGHGGAYVGFKAMHIRFPDQQFAVIFLSNRSDLDPQQFCLRIADICLEDAFTQKSPAAQNAINPVNRAEDAPPSFPLKDLSAYPGDYWSSDLGVYYKLRLQGNSLVFDQEGVPSQASLTPTGDDLFSYSFMLLKFHRDPQNVIRGFSIESDSLKGIFFTRKR